MLRSHFVIVFTMTFLSLQLVNAQVSEGFNEPFSKREAKETVKRAEDALEDAELAQSRGDTIRMEHALERYSNHINRLKRELQDGNVLHDEHEDVAEIVAQATSKHMETLEELKNKVPSQAQEGINRAYSASQSGHDTALEKLSEERREELIQRRESQAASSSKAPSSRSNDSFSGSGPSAGPGTVGPSRGGGPRGRSEGRGPR